MQFGKFDADGGLAVAEHVVRRLKGMPYAERRLIADKRMDAFLLLREPVAQRTGSAWRKALEHERTGREPAHEESHVHRARAGDHVVRDALRRALADEPVSGIGYSGIAAVRTECDLASGIDRGDNMFRDAFFVALTV